MTTTPCKSLGVSLDRTLLGALTLLTCLAIPQIAGAAEPAEPAAQPVAPPPAATPPDATKTTAPTEPPPPPPLVRKKTFGIGTGVVFWPPSDDVVDDKVDVAPALTLQTRAAFPLGGSVFGFEWTNDIVFHDWRAMGDAYEWYFAEAETESGDDIRPTKLLLLWPGLILIPFGAANYTTGFGLVVWTGKTVPSMYFDGGMNLNLYLRLSDPQFRADFGFGLYGGMGIDLFKNVGMNIRFLWGSPFIHTLIRKTSGGITTLMFNINFGH